MTDDSAKASKTGPNHNAGDLLVVSFVDSMNSRLGHEFDQQLKLRRPDARIFHYYNDHIGSDATPSEVLSQVGSIDDKSRLHLFTPILAK